MAKMREKFRNMELRKAFVCTVLCMLVLVIVLSGATIWGCVSVQKWLMPDEEKAVLSINTKSADGSEEGRIKMVLTPGEEIPFALAGSGNPADSESVTYTFDKIENSYRSLTPKRRMVYVAASAAMVCMPFLYCIVGILICAYRFYRYKLREPLGILEEAALKIARQDLDFEIVYGSGDEFGRLCASFEDMRGALERANRKMWNMLEERRQLQASIAHDLRNPLAIIRGYAEFLQINLPKENVDKQQNLMIADNIASAAARLERYTESVRHISSLEALEIKPSPCELEAFLDLVSRDMQLLADKVGIEMVVVNDVPSETVMLDTHSYTRVLENIVQNALRFAHTSVTLHWSVENGMLCTRVQDDGPGFPEEIRKRKNHTLLSHGTEHIGMGLTVSGILCTKHGGVLKVSNCVEGGGCVEFLFDCTIN